MEMMNFHDGNIHDLIESRSIESRHDNNKGLQMHSSLLRRLSIESELQGHRGCVNTISWNSTGSLLLSGSDDTRINIWSYSKRTVVHSVDTGHSANIFSATFVPESSDELVASGAGDAEVRIFNLSHSKARENEEDEIVPSAVFQCHTRRVKKLAVEVGNPNVVWSASEDGTLRQHDFREGASCPPAGASHQECRNILLDLRDGSKTSLAHPPKHLLGLKSFDISSTRPHLLLVGGSDAFARLYDRRMLPPLSLCQKRMLPPPCVNYFCPMHLSEQKRPGLHLTHVTFSPDGEEVLLSYSGEHVYVMDINYAAGGATNYTSFDVSALTTLRTEDYGNKSECFSSELDSINHPSEKRYAAGLDKCRKLMQIAEGTLRKEENYFYGIEACNEVLDGHGHEITPEIRVRCLCIRAALLLKRKWKNDAHMAVRDCMLARRIERSSFAALYYMSEALVQLYKIREALEFAEAARSAAPPGSEVAEKMDNLDRRIATAEAEKKENNGVARPGPPVARVLSLTEFLQRLEARSRMEEITERADPEYDRDLEVDFEISVPGDEGSDLDSNILLGSLNVIVHRRSESRDTGSPDGSCGSPKSQSDTTPYQPEAVVDMKQRFVGHCNLGTDIKQASFLGQKGEYVASGSDDGRWFIWEKKTGRLVKMLLGDEAVVNCVQCHPFDCSVATSGIDSTIKIWAPTSPIPSVVGGGATGPVTGNVLGAIEANQRKLRTSRELHMPFELIERL